MDTPAGHVALHAGTGAAGRPTREILPGRPLGDGQWLLLGTPALTEGCAAGDTLVVREDGSFDVTRRGGNLAVLSYAESGQPMTENDARLLRQAMTSLEGVVEMPEDGRFLVVTVPVAATFPAVEAAMDQWKRQTGRDWTYGNVYDEHDQPLNWW